MSLAIFPLWLFLAALELAPQLWMDALLGWRVDFLFLPVWVLVLLMKGRLGGLFHLRAQDWFFAIFVVWLFLSAVINGRTETINGIFLTYAKWFIIYRFVALSVTTPKELKQAALAFLTFGVVLAVQSIHHMASEDGRGWAGQPFGWVNEAAATIGLDKRTKWVGIFDGPGVFAIVFTVALPFCLRYTSPAHSLISRLLAVGVVAPLLLLGVYYTGSRGGILTSAAIFGLFVLARIRISLPKLVAVCALGVAALMLAPSYLTDIRDSSNSAQHRVSMWAEGIEMVQQNPLFGVGRWQFGKYTGSLIAHNSAIELAGETGIPGIFCWFGIAYCGIRNLALRLGETKDPQERDLLIALGISVIGYYISSLFVTLEYETLYCLLGLTAAVPNWTESQAPLGNKHLRRMVAVVLGYVLALKLFVMTYY